MNFYLSGEKKYSSILRTIAFIHYICHSLSHTIVSSVRKGFSLSVFYCFHKASPGLLGRLFCPLMRVTEKLGPGEKTTAVHYSRHLFCGNHPASGRLIRYYSFLTGKTDPRRLNRPNLTIAGNGFPTGEFGLARVSVYVPLFPTVQSGPYPYVMINIHNRLQFI